MLCPICNRSQPRTLIIKKGRKLLICQGCRHIWYEQMPTASELSEYYSTEYTELHLQEEKQEASAAYHRNHAEELRGLVGGSMAIADVGSSIPVFLREAKQDCSRRIGVDLSVQAHELGKQWGIEMMTPEGFLQTVPDESLDVLRYSHVLEHLVDPMGTLQRQVSKLKRGALVYITQPNFPVFRAEPASVDLHDSVWPSHLHFFNVLSVLAMLDRAGLRLVRFLTLNDERKSVAEYGPYLDFLTAADRLEPLKEITEGRVAFTGWPFYAGRDLACYARKEFALSKR